MSKSIEDLKMELAQHEAQKKSNAWREYQALLRKIVDGDNGTSPDITSEILKAVGKSIEDFSWDVGNLQRRDAIRARVKRAEETKPLLAKAQADLQALKDERKAFLELITPKINAADELVQSTSQIVNAGHPDQAARELRECCNDPGLLAELAAIDSHMHDLLVRMSQFTNYNREIENRQELIAEVQTQIDKLNQRRREIEKEQEAQ